MDGRRVGRVALGVVAALLVLVVAGLALVDRWLGGTPVDDGSVQLDPAPARRELDALLALAALGGGAERWDVRVREHPGELRTNGGFMGGSGGFDASAGAELRRPGATPDQVMAAARRVDRAAAARGWAPVAEPDPSLPDGCDGLTWSIPGASGGVALLSAADPGAGSDPALRLTVWRFVDRDGTGPGVAGPGSGAPADPESLACFERWVRRAG